MGPLSGCYNGGTAAAARSEQAEPELPLLKREPEIYPVDLFGPLPEGQAEAAEALAGCAPRPSAAGRSALAGRWCVAYVRSRQEKGLARHLLQSDVPFYLPQREHRMRAGDRWRVSHLPLFTGYVFFRGGAGERLKARKSNLVVSLLDVTDEAGLERELRSLWLLQLTGAPLVPHPYLGPGDEVEVVEGPLRGYQGRVVREKGKLRLIVSITLLRQSVAAELDRAALAPAKLRKVG
jgi:hypothetical protein